MTVHNGNSTSSPPMCPSPRATAHPEEPAVMLGQAGIPSACIGPPGEAVDKSTRNGCCNMVPHVTGSSCDEQLLVIDSNPIGEAWKASLKPTAGALSGSLEPSPMAQRSGTGSAGRWNMDPATTVVNAEDSYASGSSAAVLGPCGAPCAALPCHKHPA
ncbi:hypothetical protein VaNZ11_000665 [Volvox africanus]|uniref:Uncharacterized protein n=1 Tax=Volvox africanus TaxID=51714 RepID=A0ABQ5RMU1_9CHLO|nr:hypothetical protein VaNZ11_000665 [Volvox africanus]